MQSRTVSFKRKWEKESVSSITNESLYQYYQKVLAEDEMDLYIIGDISENAVDLVSKYFSISARPVRERNVLLHKRNNEEKKLWKTRIKTK